LSEPTLLGIDIGTSATKAVLVRTDGTIVGEARREHALSLPRPGWAEFDAETVWWQDVLAVCLELAPVAGDSLAGVCVSGIGPCVVPCDAHLTPLRPAILYGIDTRASAEVDELNEHLGADTILARGGSALSSQALGPKLLWLRRHEREVWGKARGWYMASSFIVARLTGEYILDHHSASQCDPLYDLGSSSWARDWIDQIAPDVPFPTLAYPAEVVGEVTSAASEATKIPVGTPVVSGTIDSWAEAFSVGVRRPGDVMLSYGSTMFVIHVVEHARPHPLLWTTQGVEAGTRTHAAGMSTGGSLTEWLRRILGGPEWPALLAEAHAAPPGARGLLLLPYFAGERTPIYDPLARGIVAGLTLRHGRGELLRASYEGVAAGIRQIFTLLTEAAETPTRVVAVGGGTNSELWLQIVSDLTGEAQRIPKQTIGAAYGDALLAAIGVGLVPADTDWTRHARIVTPNEQTRDIYNELYPRYSELYTATASIVHKLQEQPQP
jgi:xylulokinase